MSDEDNLPPEDARLLCKPIVAGPQVKGAHDAYMILWECIEGPYKGTQLETMTGIGADKFEKAVKSLGAIGIDVYDLERSQPTRNAYVTVRHYTTKSGRVIAQGKFFDAVRVGGTVDKDLAARLKHRAALLKAGKPIVDQVMMHQTDDDGFPEDFPSVLAGEFQE